MAEAFGLALLLLCVHHHVVRKPDVLMLYCHLSFCTLPSLHLLPFCVELSFHHQIWSDCTSMIESARLVVTFPV